MPFAPPFFENEVLEIMRRIPAMNLAIIHTQRIEKRAVMKTDEFAHIILRGIKKSQRFKRGAFAPDRQNLRIDEDAVTIKNNGVEIFSLNGCHDGFFILAARPLIY